MLTFKRTGRIADVIAAVRDVPERVIPYAAATALTKAAKRAQAAIQAEMPRAFQQPTSYTLNALRIETANAKNLQARVAVKDRAAGVAPEHYLLPEVEGGPRRLKRFELALRYAGLLRPGEYAVPGVDAPRDASGNLSAGLIRQVLRSAGAMQKGGKPVAPKKRGRAAGGSRYFVGAVGRKGTRGVWQSTGRGLQSVLIFTRKAPQYRQRLDFTGVAQREVEANFEADFRAAAESIVRRN